MDLWTPESIIAVITAAVGAVGTITVAARRASKAWLELQKSLDGPDNEPSLRELVQNISTTQEFHATELSRHTRILEGHGRRLDKLEAGCSECPDLLT